MYFEHKRFGKCDVICHYNDVAIVKLERNDEKYVVTIGLDTDKKKWLHGIYCKDLKEAGEIFNNLIEEFYMALFKI